MKEHTTAPDKQSKNAKGRRKRDAREQRNRDRSRCEDPKLDGKWHTSDDKYASPAWKGTHKPAPPAASPTPYPKPPVESSSPSDYAHNTSTQEKRCDDDTDCKRECQHSYGGRGRPRWPSKRKTICERDSIAAAASKSWWSIYGYSPQNWLAANTESNSTGDSTALERPSLPECAYATAAGQLMLPMLYQMAIIVGAIILIHMGPYIVGAVEAWETVRVAQGLGGVKHREVSRRPPRGASGRMRVRGGRGRVGVEGLEPRASAARLGEEVRSVGHEQSETVAHTSARRETSYIWLLRLGTRCA
ncbi:hypothetical protein EDB84DRAFT_1443724 [Lactarius hengduanensis]|nr:hypothetical protein EDB84DRAFT_1443724 [Lactarius hengduanensis]